MEVRKTGERPTEEQSKNSINSKSDSNEDPNQKPPQLCSCVRMYVCVWAMLPDLNKWLIAWLHIQTGREQYN